MKHREEKESIGKNEEKTSLQDMLRLGYNVLKVHIEFFSELENLENQKCLHFSFSSLAHVV